MSATFPMIAGPGLVRDGPVWSVNPDDVTVHVVDDEVSVIADSGTLSGAITKTPATPTRNVITPTDPAAVGLQVEANVTQTADLVRIEPISGPALLASRHDSTVRHPERLLLGRTKVQRDTFGMWDNAVGFSSIVGLGSGDTAEQSSSVLGTDDPSTYLRRDSAAFFARNHMRGPRVSAAVGTTTFTATSVTSSAWVGTLGDIKPQMVVDIYDQVSGLIIAVGLVTSVVGTTVNVNAWKYGGVVVTTPAAGSVVGIDRSENPFGGNIVVSRGGGSGTALGQMVGLEVDVWTDRADNVEIGLLAEGNGGGTFGLVGVSSHNFIYGNQISGYADYGLYLFNPAYGGYGQPNASVSLQAFTGDLEAKVMLNLGASGELLNTDREITSTVGTTLGDKIRLYGSKAGSNPVGLGVELGSLVAYVPSTAGLEVRAPNLSTAAAATSGTTAIRLAANGDITQVGNHHYIGGGGDHFYGDNSPNLAARTGGQFFVQDPTGATTYLNVASTGTNIHNALQHSGSTAGFYNTSPIVKPSSTTDLRAALINLGLYTTGGATPLDLNGGAAKSGGLDSAGAIRSTASTNTPATGSGTEVAYNAGLGYVLSFNRTGAAYTPLALWGSTVDIAPSATSKLKADSTGVGFFAATPVAKAASTTDLRQALIDYGLYTTGGASPLNLNGGLLTAGTASITGTGKTALSFSDTTTTTGLTIGADTNLYRAAADSLKTDDSFTVGVSVNVGAGINLTGSGASAAISTNGAAANTNQLYLRASGDANDRFTLDNVGKMAWGPGTSGTDTNLRRSSTGRIKSDASTTGSIAFQAVNSGGTATFGLDNSVGGDVQTGGSVYGLVIAHSGARSIHLATNAIIRQTIDSAGLVSFLATGKTAVQLPDTTTTTGFTIGADTNLYRSAADLLKTDDSLHVALDFRHLGTNLGFYNHATATQAAARTMTNWTIGSNALRTIDRNSWTNQNLFDFVMTMAYDHQQTGLFA